MGQRVVFGEHVREGLTTSPLTAHTSILPWTPLATVRLPGGHAARLDAETMNACVECSPS